jgi:hypothetical protein
MLRRGPGRSGADDAYTRWKEESRKDLIDRFERNAEVKAMADWDKDGKHLNPPSQDDDQEIEVTSAFGNETETSVDELCDEEKGSREKFRKSLPLPQPSNRERWELDQERTVRMSSSVSITTNAGNSEDDVVLRVMANIKRKVGLIV